jgi:branched-chain amino acid transport system ATP-binding protein
LTAVSQFNLNLENGELVGLIGPNGAGKTTAFNAITGIHAPTEGSVMFEGKNLVGLQPYKITKLGIARTFQNIRLFPNMPVLDNILVAFHFQLKSSWLGAAVKTPRYAMQEKTMYQEAYELLESVGLFEVRKDKAGSLPYGRQRRLEIARALAAHPKLLLLDEPAAGMNPQESNDLMEFITTVRKKYDLTIFLIEHHMQVVMGICERIYVLDHGTTIAHGSPQEIKSNQQVIEAYLGVDTYD